MPPRFFRGARNILHLGDTKTPERVVELVHQAGRGLPPSYKPPGSLPGPGRSELFPLLGPAWLHLPGEAALAGGIVGTREGPWEPWDGARPARP